MVRFVTSEWDAFTWHFTRVHTTLHNENWVFAVPSRAWFSFIITRISACVHLSSFSRSNITFLSSQIYGYKILIYHTWFNCWHWLTIFYIKRREKKLIPCLCVCARQTVHFPLNLFFHHLEPNAMFCFHKSVYIIFVSFFSRVFFFCLGYLSRKCWSAPTHLWSGMLFYTRVFCIFVST